MPNQTEKKRFRSFLVKLLLILLAVSTLFLSLYIISSIHVKNNIQQKLAPTIQELKEESGAESVDVKIFAEPDSYDLPWFCEYHVFMTVKMHDVRRVSESDILSILQNGVEEAKTEYSYDWDVLDYAIYTRSVKDSVTGRTHPIFMTISDGSIHYSIMEGSFDSILLCQKDAHSTLRPVSMNNLMTIVLLVTIALWGIAIAVAYRAIAKWWEQRKETASARNKKLLVILSCVVLSIVIVAVCVVTLFVIPNNQYKEAVSLRAAGNLDEAYAIFEELGSFRDSEEQLDDINYTKAAAFLESGDMKNAYLYLLKLKDYENTGVILAQLEADYPHLKILSSSPGDIVTLGEYEQDNDTGNGKEPIEWIVLCNDNGDVYLLSQCVLDVQQFNTANRKECTLDDWLKTTFSEEAFSSVGDDIITRVGIFQEIDVKNYGLTNDQRIAKFTSYAKSLDPDNDYNGGYSWWVIEESLFSGDGHISAPVVTGKGECGNYSREVTDRLGVRPAVWLFADPDTIPAEPVFDNSAPKQWKSSSKKSSGGSCSKCGGSGKILVTWYSEGNWGTTSYSSYDCPDC